MKLSKHTQTFFMVAALALASGCATSMPRADANGMRLVTLSTSDDLVDELVGYAQQAGCIVMDIETGADAYGRFVAHCPGGLVGVTQSHDALSYSCPNLGADDCDRLMLRLAPPTAQRLPLVL